MQILGWFFLGFVCSFLLASIWANHRRNAKKWEKQQEALTKSWRRHGQ